MLLSITTRSQSLLTTHRSKMRISSHSIPSRPVAKVLPGRKGKVLILATGAISVLSRIFPRLT
ncbi:hypothetical protein B0H19DRAFT_1168561, partial [Mycena capillaripes]